MNFFTKTLAKSFMKMLSTEHHSIFVRLLSIMDLLNQEITQVTVPEEDVSDRGITNLEIDHD